MAERELEPEVNDGAASNFLRAGRSLAGSFIAVLQTRIALLSTEIEEERLSIAAMVMIGLAALFCAGIAIMARRSSGGGLHCMLLDVHLERRLTLKCSECRVQPCRFIFIFRHRFGNLRV